MYTILVADDEEMERRGIRTVLETSCPSVSCVIEASNGIEALEQYEKNKPDIVFCDIQMPGKNGLEVARDIKGTNEDQLFVFLTAYNFFDYAREAVSLGVSEYLLKPVEDRLIIDLVKRLSDKLDARNSRPQERLTQHRGASLAFSPGGAVQGDHGTALSQRLKTLMEGAVTLIEREYSKPIGLEDVAAASGMSPCYFSKVFKQYRGCNFIDCINRLRLNKALELLADPRLSIKEVAAQAGFQDANYFGRVFKNAFGETPRDWRNRPEG